MARCIRIVVYVCCALLICLAGLVLLSPDKDLEKSIRADLEAVAANKEPQLLSQFEFICFGTFQGSPMQHFNYAAARVGQDFSTYSLVETQKCGPLHSETIGTIGLVKDKRVECVEIMSFSFFPVEEIARSFCVRPYRMKVTKEIATEDIPRTGTCCPHSKGLPYFKISERALQ